jgi:hypothetical protein
MDTFVSHFMHVPVLVSEERNTTQQISSSTVRLRPKAKIFFFLNKLNDLPISLISNIFLKFYKPNLSQSWRRPESIKDYSRSNTILKSISNHQDTLHASNELGVLLKARHELPRALASAVHSTSHSQQRPKANLTRVPLNQNMQCALGIFSPFPRGK